MTICIVLLCTVLQARTTLVERALTERLEPIAGEIQQIEIRVLQDYVRKNIKPQQLIDFMAEKRPLIDPATVLQKFRAGQLTSPADPMLMRLRGLDKEFSKYLSRLPSQELGYRPAIDGPLRMISSAFVHGGWMHLLGNMWFLFLVGCNLEDRYGNFRFLLLYLAGAVVSAFAFRLWHPDSMVSLVGASGATSAAMGAFLVHFATTRVRFFYLFWIVIFRFGTVMVQALWALPLWFLEQAVMSMFEKQGGAVAYSAHAGGFLMGLAVAGIIRVTGCERKIEKEFEDAQPGWEENPLFVDAENLRNRGDLHGAAQNLCRLLSQEPNHKKAREMIFQIAVGNRDVTSAAAAASWLMAKSFSARDYQQVLDIYRSVRGLADDATPDDKSLLLVVRSSRELSDSVTALEAARLLLRIFPASDFAPRALWESAHVQLHESRVDLARVTLHNLLERYPSDPFAPQAQKLLESLANV